MEWLTVELVAWWLIAGVAGVIWQEICIWQIRTKDKYPFYPGCPAVFTITFLYYLCKKDDGDYKVGEFYSFSGRTGWRRKIGWFLVIILGPWIFVKYFGTIAFGFFVWLFICLIPDTWNKIFTSKGGEENGMANG